MPISRIQSCIFWIVAASLLGWSCAGPQPPPEGGVVTRWIETDPETVVAATDLFGSRLEVDLGPTDDASAARWSGHDVLIHGFHDGVLRFQRDGADPWISIDTAIDADSIHAIEVEFLSVYEGEVQLFWAGRWQRFSTGRMERSDRGRRVASHTKLFRFEVGDNPAWKGAVTSLRIDVPSDTYQSMGLGAVRVFQRVIDAEKLAEGIARPWKVNLGNSARNALLALPGTAMEQTVRVPEDASLVIGYGVQPTVRGAVRFEIAVVDDQGQLKVLFEREINADGSRSGRWFDTTVDLGEFAGREVAIRLITSAGQRYVTTRGLPVWSNPEIVAPIPRSDSPNVVVILLDTLRADRLSCYGHDRATSPNIDRWAAASAVRFTNAVAPAPWTLPSHASMFTGLDAVHHGFNYWGRAPRSLEMLAEVLHDNGYTTGAVTGGGILHPDFGFAQGFDQFEFWSDPDSNGEIEWVFERARDWLDNYSQRRFFLFVHTYEIHAPHRRREPFYSEFAASQGAPETQVEIELRGHPWKDLVAPGDYFVVRRPGSDEWSPDLTAQELEEVGLRYDSAVAKADREVGQLLDHLKTLGLRGRTVVVIASDHGEALGEDGRAGHAYLNDYNLMVPLMIELPGGDHAGAVIDPQVRLLDIMPTVLETVGIVPGHELDGKSLLPLAADPDAAFPNRAWAYAASSNLGLALRLDNRLKFVFPDAAWAELANREQLFNLPADPAEANSLSPGDPRLGELRAAVKQTILDQHQGIRLEIRNSDPDLLVGTLDGAWASHDRVKTADHDCRCVHWKPKRPAFFQLKSGQETTLLFNQLQKSEVEIQGRTLTGDGESASEFQQSFDLESIETPAALFLTPTGWQLVEGFDGEVATGFLITRVGEAQPIVGGGAPTETEIVEQLKALGYVQ